VSDRYRFTVGLAPTGPVRHVFGPSESAVWEHRNACETGAFGTSLGEYVEDVIACQGGIFRFFRPPPERWNTPPFGSS